METKLLKFAEFLKSLRLSKNFSLREICKIVDYDPSNWSKIERGVIAPPSNTEVLKKWAIVLGLSKKSEDFEKFMDYASIAQGIIPHDIVSDEDIVSHLPAFFRTLRNKKPTKEEIDRLIELIKRS